jgi:RNA polymerase sigma-70 factor (ECF subfamily)
VRKGEGKMAEELWRESEQINQLDESGTALTTEATDYELVQKAVAGDTTSFEELYRRHMKRVYALCLRMTANPTEAEDLTQEVFTHLYRKLGSFRGESAFTTWLHRLTVNLILMHFRKRQSRPEFTSPNEETPDQIVKGTENPGAMSVLDRLALEKAIAKLAPGYRTVFVLHDIEGFEHEEIAKVLGISVGTSKSQLHRARLNLRKLIRQDADAAEN